MAKTGPEATRIPEDETSGRLELARPTSRQFEYPLFGRLCDPIALSLLELCVHQPSHEAHQCCELSECCERP